MNFSPKERGETLLDFALMLVLIAILIIAAVVILGSVFGTSGCGR